MIVIRIAKLREGFAAACVIQQAVSGLPVFAGLLD
jgi:hypothetical protein